MQNPERMGTDPILKLILSFALPSIVGMLANALYNIVDRIFVGRIVGPDGLAAISLAFPFMIFNIAVCLLFGVGAAPLMSIALGENDPKRAERILGSAVSGVFFVSCIFASLCLWKLDPLLKWSGASDALLASAREYLRIILWGVPLGSTAFTLNFCIRAEGRPAFAMSTQMLGALANIALDALFINYMGMGIAGAAWGTILSQGLSAAWVLSFYLLRRGVLRLTAKNLAPRFSELSRILPLGFASFMTEISFTLFLVLFNRALMRHGGDMAVSAMGACMGWDSLLFLPVIGIGEAVQTLFAYNYGAQLLARLVLILKYAFVAASAYFFSSMSVVWLWAEKMLLFFTDDPELLDMAAQGMRFSYAGVIFMGIAQIVTSFFQGLGRGRESLFFSLARQVLFLLPAIYFFPQIWGLTGVWYCFPAIDAGTGALALFLLSREYRRLSLKTWDREINWLK